MRSETENGLDFEVNIRIFDSNRPDDLKGLRETIQSPGVQKWMIGLDNLKQKDFYKMMSFIGQHRYYMYAVTCSVMNEIEDNKMHGFIFVCPSPIDKRAIEVSFAKRPGSQSGLIVMALRKACVEVKELINIQKALNAKNDNKPIRVVAGTLPGNTPAMKVLLGAGFESQGTLENGNGMYELNWSKLEEIINTGKQPVVSLS